MDEHERREADDDRHVPDLVLPVERQNLEDLGQWVMSLLGQRRLIEKEYDVPMMIVRHESIKNLLMTIIQRIQQNQHALVSFRCKYYFSTGKICTVETVEAFEAFLDRSQDLSVGVDISATFLVNFGTTKSPEKQDIRIEIFSDSTIRTHLRHQSRQQRPMLKYSINCTNVTWGEDVSNHIDPIMTRFTETDRLFRISRSICAFVEQCTMATLLIVALLLAISVIVIFSAHGDSSSQRLAEALREAGPSWPNQIMAKIDFLISIGTHQEFPLSQSPKGGDIPRLAFVLSTIAAACIAWRVSKNVQMIYYVALNDYTENRLLKEEKRREIWTLYVYIPLAVSVLSGLLASRIDHLFAHIW